MVFIITVVMILTVQLAEEVVPMHLHVVMMASPEGEPAVFARPRERGSGR
jgi:hypothetical protein